MGELEEVVDQLEEVVDGLEEVMEELEEGMEASEEVMEDIMETDTMETTDITVDIIHINIVMNSGVTTYDISQIIRV